MAPYTQWVNLQKKSTFVEDDIGSLGQLDTVDFKVTFTKAAPTPFEVSVTEVTIPHPYSSTETNRYRRFKLKSVFRDALEISDGAKTYAVLEAELPPAGGNTYELCARLDGTVVSSRTVTTKRKVYFQNIAMAGVDVPDLSDVTAVFDAMHIAMKEKGGTVTMTHQLMVGVRDEDQQLMREAAKHWGLRKYEPWALAVLWVDMLPKVQVKTYKKPVTIWASLQTLSPYPQQVSFTLPGRDLLWWGFDANDDAANGGRGRWMVSARFVPASGSAIDIPEVCVTLDPDAKPRYAEGGHQSVRVLIPPRLRNLFSNQVGQLELSIRAIVGWRLGLAWDDVNALAVAQRSAWQPVTDPIETLLHELGHKIGLVSDGTRLDPGKYLYGGRTMPDECGHQGPHCKFKGLWHNGSRTWKKPGECIMFGAGGPKVFCADCMIDARKTELDGRQLDGFRRSFTTV